MKRFGTIVILIVVIAGLFFLLRTKNPPAEVLTPQNAISSSHNSNVPIIATKPDNFSSTATNQPRSGVAAQTDLAYRAASPNAPSTASAETNGAPVLAPLTVLDKARVVIHNYRAAFGENPVGTNPEIAAALQGKNPKQIDFLTESGLRLNDKGEIVDGYGTPFFFHQISGQEMEIRSAGQDRVLWTRDDLVTK